MNELIETLLKDHEPQHSDFQIDNFIVGNQGDDWAQYKQALREIKSRNDLLKSKTSEIKALKNAIAKYKNKNLNGRGKIKYRQLVKGYNNLICESRGTLKELKRFVFLAEKLKEKIGEVTDERRQQLELESWTAKGRRMAAIDRFLTGSISHQTFEFILSLPVESQNSILDKILPDNLEKRLLIEDLQNEVSK